MNPEGLENCYRAAVTLIGTMDLIGSEGAAQSVPDAE